MAMIALKAPDIEVFVVAVSNICLTCRRVVTPG